MKKDELSYFGVFYIIALLSFAYFAYNTVKAMLPSDNSNESKFDSKNLNPSNNSQSINYDKAIDSAFNEIDNPPKATHNTAESYYRSASDKFMLEDNAGALIDCNKAITMAKNYLEAYKLRSRIKAEMGDKLGSDADLKIYVSLKNKQKQ